MADHESNANPNWTIMVYIAADEVLSDFAVGSLRQLRHLTRENPNIVAVAQFDANGKQNVLRLTFDGVYDKNNFVQASKMEAIAPTDMATPTALRDFINWTYTQHKAKHYCLVLWGHGPELLVGDYPTLADGERAKKFLTPCDVKKALQDSKLVSDGHRFAILMMDACNMSIIELACDISDYVEFLVASQEEVPDFSFPYDKLLSFGKTQQPTEIEKACREMPGKYIAAYQDYLLTRATQTQSITLSSFSLKNIESLAKLWSQFAEALLEAPPNKEKRRAVLNARANSKDFVLGLYVDIYDFCEQLSSRLFPQRIDEKLRLTCEQICEAIRTPGENSFLIANMASQDQRCHGISVYFPYLTVPLKIATNPTLERGETNPPSDFGKGRVERTEANIVDRNGVYIQEKDKAQALNIRVEEFFTESRGSALKQQEINFLSKGGADVLNKGGADVLNKGGADVLNKMRRQRIGETELYYGDLLFSEKTRWDEFIRHCWTRWLVEDVEAKAKSSVGPDIVDVLDQHHSAQQCALNLLSLCWKLEQNGNPSTHVDEKQIGYGESEQAMKK